MDKHKLLFSKIKKRPVKQVSSKMFFQEWLEKLQQESWQLELLISGFALFGIYESRDLLEMFSQQLHDYQFGQISVLIKFLQIILQVGWLIFFINLLVHVILRALWIGTIGLRYISSKIEYDSLNYSDLFTKYLKKKVGSYDDFIEKLEKICSVLFAYTFLLFLLFLSLISFLGIGAMIVQTGVRLSSQGKGGDILVLFFLLYLLLGVLVFIDFITLGGFKRIKDNAVSKVYFYIYRFYSIITFSFLYRPLLYNFIDQKYTRRLFFFSVPYILIISFSSKLFTNNNYPFFSDFTSEKEVNGLMIDDFHYDDLREHSFTYEDKYYKKNRKGRIPPISLSQFYMDKPYPSIFIRMEKSDQNLLIKKKDLQPIYKPGFRFSLFSKDKYEDKNYTYLKDSLDTHTSNIGKQLRITRDSLRRLPSDSPLSQTLTLQLNQLRDSLSNFEITKKEKFQSFEWNKIERIRDTMQQLTEFYIDDIPYSDSMICHYYLHPNFKEKGFLYHFNSNYLAEGQHNLKIIRTIYKESAEDSLMTYTYILPFLKIK